jgi:hypothetical protein
MDALEFMQGHADKAVAGKIPEIMGDLTPEAMAALPALMAGGPNPATSNKVTAIGNEGDDHIFDVTYSNDSATVTMREWVRQIDGTWKIVKLAKPA